MVLCDDPDDLCVRCLGLWDFRVSSDAGKSEYQKHYEKSKAWGGARREGIKDTTRFQIK